MRQPLVVAGSVIALALLVGFVLYFTSANQSAAVTVACPIAQQVCEFSTPYGEARFELTPQPPSSKAPIAFELRLSAEQPQRVWIDLQGKEMYMGVNQTNLKFESGSWSALGTLGVCTTGTMRWVLALILERGDEQQIYNFEFDAR